VGGADADPSPDFITHYSGRVVANRNAFTRVDHTIAKYQSIDVTALVRAVLRAPLEAVAQAIGAKDASQFDMAYAELTEACNVCHRNRNHAEIVIKVPDAAMFPDQEFQPPPLRQ
jgi:hypothetical protein